MTIKTLGMGIVKFLKTTAPRKTLTVDKGALRISEINKKLKKTPKKAHVPGFTEKASVRQDVAEEHAQEVLDIYNKGKK